MHAAHNGDRLLAYAERRVGKTCLVKRVIDDLADDEYCLYMPTCGPRMMRPHWRKPLPRQWRRLRPHVRSKCFK